MRCASRGYRTVYATDEVRFANIDRVIRIRPVDHAADRRRGFPAGLCRRHAARESRGREVVPAGCCSRRTTPIGRPCVTYEPRQFVRRLERELSIRRPHAARDPPDAGALALCLGRHCRRPTVPEEYRACLRRCDRGSRSPVRGRHAAPRGQGRARQRDRRVAFGSWRSTGAETDSMLRKTGTSREIWDSLWGHGTSVMSPHQYQVLLAMRAYGRARLPGLDQDYDWPVSLEDLRPTLEQYATGKAPADVDGISLLPYLRGSRARRSARVPHPLHGNGFQYAQTSRRPLRGLGDHRRGRGLLRTRYDSGWVQFREDRLPELLARKQRAAISSNSLLAAIPGPRARVRATSSRTAGTPRQGPWKAHRTLLPNRRPGVSGMPSRRAFRANCRPTPNCPECEPGQGLVGRTMGAFRRI